MAQLLPYTLGTASTLSSAAGGNAQLSSAFQQLFQVLNIGQQQVAKVVNDYLSGAGATLPDAAFIGQEFFNTTTGQPNWWNGSAWVGAGSSGSSLEIVQGTTTVSSVQTLTVSGSGVTLSSSGTHQAALAFSGSSGGTFAVETEGTGTAVLDTASSSSTLAVFRSIVSVSPGLVISLSDDGTTIQISLSSGSVVLTSNGNTITSLGATLTSG